MKLFEVPYVEVVKFAVQDVITTSTGGDDGPPPLETLETFCVI